MFSRQSRSLTWIPKIHRPNFETCNLQLATKFGDALIQRVNEFLEHLIKSIREQIGRCGPVSNAYNATLVAGCKRVLDPFVSHAAFLFDFLDIRERTSKKKNLEYFQSFLQNGFWVSVGWCLILFLPTIVLCVKLGSLYQKSDPYPGPLVES